MSKKKPVIAGLGELLWDQFPSGRQIGGAPANFAYHCGVLGAESYVVSAVGNDEAGRDILSLLQQKGVDTGFIEIVEDHPTGSVHVALSEEGTPHYDISENVAWDFISGNTKLRSLAARADAVCFGTLAQRSPVSRKGIRSILEEADLSCFKVFDPNLRQHYYDKDMILEGLRVANVLKLNSDEMEIVAGFLGLSGKLSTILDEMSTRFALTAIAVTKGENGCTIKVEDQTVDSGGESTHAVLDTVGAGDCFTAAFVMGLLNCISAEDIASTANARAAYVCTRVGAMPEMP